MEPIAIFIFAWLGLIVIYFIIASIYILANGELDKKISPRGSFNLSFLLSLTATFIPIILYLILMPSNKVNNVNSDIIATYCAILFQAQIFSIPITFSARWFNQKAPVPIIALLKELPYTFFAMLFIVFFSRLISYSINANAEHSNATQLFFLLCSCGLIFTLRKFFAALIAYLAGKQVEAKIISNHTYEPISLEVPITIYVIKYKTNDGYCGKLCYYSGIFDCSMATPPKEGETIKLWYTPKFGGVSYYNY